MAGLPGLQVEPTVKWHQHQTSANIRLKLVVKEYV